MRGAIHAGPGLGVWHRSHGAPWRDRFHIFNCAIIFSWAARAPLGKNVVVVQHNAKRAGLVVDTLFGATQTVINPWAHLFKDVSGVSGSAIMGNGRVALILDVPACCTALNWKQWTRYSP